jgi:hypothetical protein
MVLFTCPGRGAAFFMPLRRAGTQLTYFVQPGPRLCSAPLRKSYALRCVRGTKTYRTSSFIALSSPSIVIGYMRCENSRRMRVVDSE